MKYILLLISFSVLSFDHSHAKFDSLLQKYVSYKKSQSLVDYKGFKKDKSILESYLADLSAVEKKTYNNFSADEKLAFLINAYNAFTIKLIVENYPVESIKDIGSLFTSPWKKKFFKLFGKKMTLDGIEHGTIRKQFKEPRIHFAVNCASLGCPSLYNRAFIPGKLDVMLELVTQKFLNNKEKNFVKNDELHISKIFDWYGDDFDVAGGVETFIKKKLKLKGSYDLEYLDYDWDLNEKK
ncbi:MAG: DUF547 domain-containing protein [Bacteriovoracaceae bacterium]|jgi:hypothetical protein|nr:DUF547 domain-containing protein [Bacteriovoracaceae bacterium]